MGRPNTAACYWWFSGYKYQINIKLKFYLSVTCFIACAANLLASFFLVDVVLGDIAMFVAH